MREHGVQVPLSQAGQRMHHHGARHVCAACVSLHCIVMRSVPCFLCVTVSGGTADAPLWCMAGVCNTCVCVLLSAVLTGCGHCQGNYLEPQCPL